MYLKRPSSAYTPTSVHTQLMAWDAQATLAAFPLPHTLRTSRPGACS